MKVFITQKIPEIAKNILLENGFEVEEFKEDRPIKKEELIELASEADAVLSLLTDKIDKSVIDQLPDCKIISNYAVGFNNIDVDYAGSKGIIVTNTPDILTDATADIAMTLMLASARRLVEGEKYMRNKKFTGWKPQLLMGIELRGKNVGIIGAGRIGYETAKRAKSFGTNIIYYSRSRKDNFEKELDATFMELDDLMKESDIISLHIPLNEETHKLLNKERLEIMKKDAIVINTARGEVIDEKYLIKMLKEGKIFSAGFDVYENEPIVNEELFELDNVVLLPHLGSATFDTRKNMAELCANNIANVLNGKDPITRVN